MPVVKPRYFRSAAEFGRWLEREHGRAPELWVGFHKRATERALRRLRLRGPAEDDAARCRRAFQTRPGAGACFAAQPSGHRRTIIWWVLSAKQEAARARRLATLVEECARGRRVGLLSSKPPAE